MTVLLVEKFIFDQKEEQQDILFQLNDLITSFNLTPKMRYKVPFYYNNSWVCYLNPIKDHGVELCFTRGNELEIHKNLLDFKDRKQVAGMTFTKIQDINHILLKQILEEAIFLDETKAYTLKRTK